MAIRWGIIGCGDVTEVKSGPAFQKARESELVAVMRRDAGKAEDYARRHGVARWYGDADALIADPGVDAVYVATPPGNHMEYALCVAAAGKPCYVEKPMARTHAECLRMVEAFERAKTPLFVAYYRRMLPRFLKAKELIDSGRLGRLTGCTYRMTKLFWPEPGPQWRLEPEHSGGGLILDLGSHTLDMLDYLLGGFVESAGNASRINTAGPEDVVAISFRTGSGVVGTASWNFAGSCREDLITIDGTEGRLQLTTFGEEPVRLERGDTVETFATANPPHIQQPLIQSIVDELTGTGKCPSTGHSGARTSRVIDTALNSFYGGRSDAFWNRPQTWGKA